MNSSTNSSDITHSTQNERKPKNPLLLTSSSSENKKDSQQFVSTFCSKFEDSAVERRNPSSDLFSEAPSSNLNDLINILSNKVSNVCVLQETNESEKSEIISTAYQRPSDSLSSFAIESGNDVICLSSGPDTDNESTISSEEVIEVSDEETDEYEKVEARINFMTSSLESRESRSTLGRKSRMERFLKDVSQNLKTLSLEEDDFKVKPKVTNAQCLEKEDYNQNGKIFKIKTVYLTVKVVKVKIKRLFY